MASYTMELREALATLLVWDGVDVSKLNTKDLIEQGRQKLFNFDYEIFDVNYKVVWETNFIRNFFFREIGFETEDLFQFQLETWIRINMPYFNKLFTSETLKFDPLMNASMDTNYTNNKDRDLTENVTSDRDTTKTNHKTLDGTEHKSIDGTENKSIDGTENTDANGSKNGSSFNRHLESETPDNRLTITSADGVGVIEYASKIDEDKNTSSESTINNVDTTRTNTIDGSTTNTIDGTTTNTIDGTDTDKTNVTNDTTSTIKDVESYVSNRVGKTGDITYSEMVMKYRESFIRIEKRMFDEMQELFMLVY